MFWYAQKTEYVLFQVFTGLSTCFLNFYIVVAIFIENELRCINMYPIGLQASCDILTGLAFAHESFLRILIHTESFSYAYTGSLAEWFRSNSFFHPDYYSNFSVGLRFCRDKLNYYSTGYCIALIAIERYVIVCKPFKVNEILTTRNKYLSVFFLNLLLVASSTREILCRNVFSAFFNRTIREYMCFEDVNESIWEAFLFFLAPSIITCVLYASVGFKLAKVSSNQSRNRDLTIAFLISCLLWIVLWLPRIIKVFLQALLPPVRMSIKIRMTKLETISAGFEFVDSALYLLNPFINPIIFIFVSRGFQKPLRALWLKLHGPVCRKN